MTRELYDIRISPCTPWDHPPPRSMLSDCGMLLLHGVLMLGAYEDVAHPKCHVTQNRSSGPTFVANRPLHHHHFAPSTHRPKVVYHRGGRAEVRERADSVAAGVEAKQLHSSTCPCMFFFRHHFLWAFQTTTAYFCAKRWQRRTETKNRRPTIKKLFTFDTSVRF
jgi:hypothetical protein